MSAHISPPPTAQRTVSAMINQMHEESGISKKAVADRLLKKKNEVNDVMFDDSDQSGTFAKRWIRHEGESKVWVGEAYTDQVDLAQIAAAEVSSHVSNFS